MRKFYIVSASLFIFSALAFAASFAEEERKEPRLYSVPAPVVSPGSSGISPLSQPNITTPPVASGVINMPSHRLPAFPQSHIPGVPVYTTLPARPFETNLPQVPIIANTIGKVLNIGSEKDGTSWIEVKDRLLNQLLKLKIKDLKNTPIVKGKAIARFGDIKIGDTVNVIFGSEGEENIANFISILTEKEVEMMKETRAGTSEEIDTERNK